MLDLDGKLYLLSDAERATLEARYADKVGRYTPIQALHNGVSLLGFHAEPTVPDWFMIRWWCMSRKRPARTCASGCGP
jgi:hypothetical protein